MEKNKSDEHRDEHTGRVISRREAIRLFAASPFILSMASCSRGESTPVNDEEPLIGSCVVRPELTEGPFYVDTNAIRSDISDDREGVSLALNFNVQSINGNTCSPIQDALFDVWHADANGDYSSVGNFQNEQFLRGIQPTDSDGNASFTTIFPGWYRGRTPHIHFKVRSSASSGSAYEFTSQLFFETELSKQVYQQAPYSSRGLMDTTNSRDGIYVRSGSDMLLAVSEMEEGYEATFNLALHID